MSKFIKKYQYQIFLFFIVLILFLVNYKSGTYLSGWDNLQTELNPWLGVKRALFSVWEEYQSFGLLAGMAHASDLVRAIFIWIISFVLPQNTIRYFYHFLMLFVGGLGMLKLLTQNSKLKTQNYNSNLKTENEEKTAFLASLFYILNLGTIQIFYLPFEPFSTFFAFLPWGIWSYLNITWNVERGTYKKNLIIFFLINLLGTPSFYTQQLFVVYILILLLLTLGLIINNFLSSKFQVISYKFHASRFTFYVSRFTFHVSLIFLINSFWLLPQLYFLKTSSNVVYEAKANQLSTEDVYYQNREKGTLKYFLRLEGFYYDLFDKNNQPLFLPWKNHFKNFWPLQYFFTFLMALGIIYSLKKKNYTFIFPFILIIIAFLNATWPITLLDQIIRSNKFLNQIFRSPFTKFIIPYSLLYSYFLFQGIILLNNFLSSKFYILRSTFYVLLLLIIFYSFPAFTGNFFSNEMKIKIPKDYFEVIDYFKKTDKNRRIALFPDYTFWGWFFHRWGLPADRQGYNGSGFLWYGIEQPIVSRTFDVWSDKSEGYFWEIKGAVEAEDLNRFEAVLDKYDIDYLLIDYSLLPVVGSIKGLAYDRLENLISLSSKIKPAKKWQNLALYQFEKENKNKDFTNIKTNLIGISPKIKITDFDYVYLNYGEYFFKEDTIPQAIFPFQDLISLTKLPNKKWQVNELDNFFEVEFNSNIDLSRYQPPKFNENLSAIFYLNDQLTSISAKLKYEIKKNNLKILFPKIKLAKINEKDFIKSQCFPKTTCFSYSFDNLPQKYSYLLKIKNKNYAGRRLYFYILDQTKKQSFLEDRLKKNEEIYFLPPKYQYGIGYSIVFHQNNYENLKSENKIESVELYLFPYENLKSLQLINSQFYLLSDHSKDRIYDLNYFQAQKINYFIYEVSLPKSTIEQFNNLIIYFSQSYHPGWKAYVLERRTWNLERIFPFIFSEELKDHVIVNNWANGWQIKSKTWNLPAGRQGAERITYKDNLNNYVSRYTFYVILLFWPQYWQFLGFGLLIIAFIFILKLKFKD